MMRARCGAKSVSAALLAVLVGCGAKTELRFEAAPRVDAGDGLDVQSPRDVPAEDVPPAVDVVDVADVPDVPREDVPVGVQCPPAMPIVSASLCRATLRVGLVRRSMPTCFVDLAVAEGQEATLEFDCDGGGARIRTADGRTFQGVFDGVRVSVCFSTAFDWGDGCRWQSAQRVVGALASGTLSLEYTEAPVRGEACLPPCSANAVVAVQR